MRYPHWSIVRRLCSLSATIFVTMTTRTVPTSLGREIRFTDVSPASDSDDDDECRAHALPARKRRAPFVRVRAEAKAVPAAAGDANSSEPPLRPTTPTSSSKSGDSSTASEASFEDDDAAQSTAECRKREGTPGQRPKGKVREFWLRPRYDLLPYHTISTVAVRARRAANQSGGVPRTGPRYLRFIDVAPDSSESSEGEDASESEFEHRDIAYDSGPEKSERDDPQSPDVASDSSDSTEGEDASESASKHRGVACDVQVAGDKSEGDDRHSHLTGSDSEAADVRSACAWLTDADYRRLTSRNGWLNDVVVNAYAELVNSRNATYFSTKRATALAQATDGTLLPGACVAHPRKRTPVRTRSTRAGDASDKASVLVEGGRRKTFVLGSFFYEQLTADGQYDYSRVRRWTRHKSWCVSTPPQSILEYGKILVPVNLDKNHWVLAAIDVTYRRFVYMDSLQRGDECGVLPNLRRWVIDELRDKHTADVVRLQEVGTWEDVINPPFVGKQKDGDSCGMFVVALADHLELAKLPAITQGDIPALREEAARCLREGMLPVE